MLLELCWSVCVCVGPYRRPRPMYCILYTHHSRVWRNQWSLFLLANWLHQFLKCTKWHAALLRSSIKFVILVSPHLYWRFVGNRIGPWLASTTSQFLCSFFVILDGIDIKIIDSRWIWSVKLGDCYFLRVSSSNLNRKDNILVLQKRTMKYSLIWSSFILYCSQFPLNNYNCLWSVMFGHIQNGAVPFWSRLTTKWIF